MKVTGATLQEIEQAADETGIRLYNLRVSGHGYAFTLKTGEPNEQRIDWRGKLVRAPRYQRLSQCAQRSTARGHEGKEFARVVPGVVCWHGHRDFFRALYKLAPQAVVRTAMAVYRNAGNFESQFEATRYAGGDRMGVHMTPYADACTCDRPIHRPYRSAECVQEKYNGWTNYDTWNVALWVGNEESWYRAMMTAGGRNQDFTADSAEAFARDLWPSGKTPDNAELDTVNWQEIVDSWNEV